MNFKFLSFHSSVPVSSRTLFTLIICLGDGKGMESSVHTLKYNNLLRLVVAFTSILEVIT